MNQPTKDILTEQEYLKYYSVTLDSDGLLEVAFSHEKISGNNNNIWNISIVNKFDKEFVGKYSVGNVEKMMLFVGLQKGTYYIQVEGYNRYLYDNYRKYSYEITPVFTKGSGYEKEFNGNTDSANDINVNTTTIGSMQNDDDVDYYNLIVEKAGLLEMSFDHEKLPGISSRQWEVTIMNSLGKEIKVMDSLGNEESVKLVAGLPQGKYIIEVKPYMSYLDGVYFVDVPCKLISKFTVDNYCEKEFNDNINVANLVELNKNYTKGNNKVRSI